MKDYIQERVLMIADFIISNRSTVRSAAKRFGYSKSTVHKDLVERLPNIDASLVAGVRAVLEQNKAERHLRGGEATKYKYLNIK